MILLDTHALLWWTLDPGKLSPRAARVCDRIAGEGGAISSISFWELGIKIKNGKLDIGISIEEYASRVKKMNLLSILAIDEALWIASLALPWDNRDPADRIIVATAIHHQAELVSIDGAMRSFYLKTVW